MAITYQLVEGTDVFDKGCVIRTDDEGVVAHIPIAESNADYQAYLAWKAAQPQA